jgi:exodeoxyribonuclease V alpha subunit
VGTGSFFSDLIDLIPTAYLRTSLRSDRKEVLDLAEAILEGKSFAPHGPLSFEVVRHYALQENSMILTPLQGGPWGVKALNQKIHAQLQPKSYPIMVNRNDTETGLSNGDLGIMQVSNGKIASARFQMGSEMKEFSSAILPSYELAYVLSIHKSQGSEFDHVLVIAPPGAEQFGREILYTAVTRAKKSVTLIGEMGVIAQTIERTCYRRSGLRKRWTTL